MSELSNVISLPPRTAYHFKPNYEESCVAASHGFLMAGFGKEVYEGARVFISAQDAIVTGTIITEPFSNGQIKFVLLTHNGLQVHIDIYPITPVYFALPDAEVTWI